VCAPVVNIEYKFVDPLKIVPPLNVDADNPAEKFELPDAVTEANEGDETTFIVGFAAVPPVVIFVPG